MKLATCGALLLAVTLAGCTDRAQDRVSYLMERAKSMFGSKSSKEQVLVRADLLTQLTSWDAIGMNLAYVQERAGPPIRSEDHRHYYKVQGCQLVLKSDPQDKAIRSVQVALKSDCNVDIGGLLGILKRQPPNALTFGAFDDAVGSAQYLADCLRDCGNAYVPSVYLVAQGSRALQFKQVMLTAGLGTDAVIQAAGQWADAMVAKESENWVVRDLTFNCQPQKYRDVASKTLGTLPPEFLSFGDELEFPSCSTMKETSASLAEMVMVPQPVGQCDMEYERRLLAVGLRANEVAIHGPDDQDFKGYGCAYRIRPIPGNSISPGSTVSYRSAWEAG